MPSPYERLKTLAARAIRPGLQDLTARMHEVQTRLAQLEALQQDQRGKVDRLTAQAEKHRDHSEELGFWRWLVKTEEGRKSIDGPFEQVFGGWQRDRLRELARVLNLGEWGASSSAPEDGDAFERVLDAWCAEQSVVEIGGGPFPAVAAAPRWRSAVAADPLAKAYIEEGLVPALGTGHITHLAASGEDVPLPACSADLLIIENALDHVTNPQAVVREGHRLLKPGGRIWVLVDLSDYRDAMHPHPFNADRVRTLLRDAGFTIDHERTSDHHSHPKAYGEMRVLARK
jgi:SAM-dependent methyltransferase